MGAGPRDVLLGVRLWPALVIVGVALLRAILPSAAGAVFNGYDADPAQFPSFVTLTLKGAENCGGALIGRDVVVTAAHCVSDGQWRHTRIVFQYKSRNATTVGISRIVEHGYDPMSKINDIALLVLRSQPSSAVPIGLVGADPQIGTRLTAVGFGCSSRPYVTATARCKRFPSRLQGIVLQAVRRGCQEISATDLCVTGEKASVNHGDSGGPVLIRRGATWQLAGLVDLIASDPTHAPYYNDITSIAQQLSWIDAVLGARVAPTS